MVGAKLHFSALICDGLELSFVSLIIVTSPVTTCFSGSYTVTIQSCHLPSVYAVVSLSIGLPMLLLARAVAHFSGQVGSAFGIIETHPLLMPPWEANKPNAVNVSQCLLAFLAC